MKRVLLIDDCDDFREATGELLADAGYEVTMLGSVDELEQVFNATPFDVVLCDLVLPMVEDLENLPVSDDSSSAMVGVHAIRALSKLDPKVPVVAISGALTGEPLKMMYQFGAKHVLSKPFGRDELLSIVERAIGEQ